ncbi:MAG TPA: S8 family serine peptidase [Casimicrobiaceae bacterium]|nr:S8 family serine peptidase [Casimicrobiaceae bacterium]
MLRATLSQRNWRPALTAAALAVAALFALPTEAARTISDATVARQTEDRDYALVQLNGEPLATYSKTKPGPGKKIDFDSSTVKSYRAQLSALRNDFKQWLRANAPKAKVTGEFDVSLNAVGLKLNGEALATIAAAPQVLRAQYQGLYYPSVDPDLDLIQAPEAWTDAGGGPPNPTAGDGVKVAIIDSGIDFTHPCFSDAGYPTQTQLGDARFTNNKVIVAKVFNNKTPGRRYTAEALDAHGTHVAGTVGCNYGTAANVDGVAITHPISGVAPRALLGNYNIFPAGIASARSEDILNALDAAYADGFDVANMSLGGGASGIQDLLTVAVDNLDQANMVVAVAAGNSGPGHFTVESPGSARRALTAGAATVGHVIATPITVDGVTAAGVAGDFATVSSDLTANLKAVLGGGANGLSTACTSLPAASLSGTIALVARGTCSFSTKIRNAQDAGAVAVLVSNNVAGDGIGMAQDGTPNQPTVFAYNVSITDGASLKAHDGQPTTISASPAYLITGNDDFMAGFSGQGPTDVDFRVKPDVVAPGVNVLSSIPYQFCATPPCFAFFQGTSMATPHLAGSAAVLRWANPSWSAAQIRSATVNTAAQGVLKKTSSVSGTPETDVNITGAGREDLLAAINAAVALDPVSVSYGAVPSGSGQTRSLVVTVTNLDTVDTFLTFSVDAGDTSVAYALDTASAFVPAGASTQVTVTMSAAKGAAAGDHQAWLYVKSSAGAELAHAAVYTLIK